MQTLGKVYYNACFVAVLSVRPLMLCSSTQCSRACVVVLALVPGYNIFWVWEKLPFPDFLGRFASRQAASGISECSVAASLLLEFSSARFSNRRISECFVAASQILLFLHYVIATSRRGYIRQRRRPVAPSKKYRSNCFANCNWEASK